MIELRTLSGESLDMYPDTKLKYVRKNPFFLQEVVMVSGYIENFILPVTPNNNKHLQFFVSPGTYFRGESTIPIDVIVDGNLFMRGDLNIFKSNESQYNVSITRRYVRFQTELRLREMDLGVIVFGTKEGEGEEEINALTRRDGHFGKSYPEVPYVFPMFQCIREDGYAIRKETQSNPEAYLRPINWNGGPLNKSTDKDLVIPMFFLPWVIQKIVRAAGDIHAEGAFLHEELIQDKVIYNTTCVHDGATMPDKLFMPIANDRSLYEFSYIYVAHPSFDPAQGRINGVADQVKNYFEFAVDTIISFTVYYSMGGSWSSTLVEYITTNADSDPYTLLVNMSAYMVSSVPGLTLMAIEGVPDGRFVWAKFNYGGTGAIYIDGTGQTGPTKLRVNNNCIVDFADKLNYQDIRPQMHLPDITLSEFLTGISQFYNLAIYLDDKSDRLNFVNKSRSLRGEHVDVTPYWLNNHSNEYKEKFNMFLEFKNDSDDKHAENIRHHANNYHEHVLNPQTRVEVRCATLAHNEEVANSEVFILVFGWQPGMAMCPVVEQKMGSYAETTPFSLRLLKYEGVKEIGFVSSPHYYLQCSNIDLTPNEAYTYAFKEWYQIMRHSGRFFWFKFQFTLDFLLNLDLAMAWRVGSNDYVWEEISTVIGMQGIEESEVKMLKI